MTARTSTRQIYYGWRIAGSLAVTETVSWGILYYAFSVFLVPMQDELGWSLTVLTGAYSLALLCSGLVAPLVGRFQSLPGPQADDRHFRSVHSQTAPFHVHPATLGSE